MEWDEVATLADMVGFKDGFVSDPGCDVDFDSILAEMPEWDGSDPDAACREWFDRIVGLFDGKTEITVYRHMTVEDFDGFVDALEAGQAAAGAHWSLDEGTFSPFPEQKSVDILLKGTLEASQVDWSTTFQNFFSCPWEREVSFEGEIRVDWVREVEGGRERCLGGLPAAAFPSL